jgi:RNA polymerase sigma-70 factor (ECF subfamily)
MRPPGDALRRTPKFGISLARGASEASVSPSGAIWYNYLSLGKLRSCGYRRIVTGDNPRLFTRRTQKGRAKRLSSSDSRAALQESALVSAIRAGDQGAMAALYDRYSSIVYGVALRVLGDTGAAEDVQQDVFMQLWRNPAAFDASRGHLGAWLAVIARNRSIDVLRKRKPEDDVGDVVLSVVPDMAADADRSRIANQVRKLLGAMPSIQRAALEMAYYEGLTHSEIAAKTGEPLGTIKTRIRAGLIALRKAFQE